MTEGLDSEIKSRRREIATERYAMSIGELTSLYRDNELIVHPEFQRFFRWDDDQKSRLVESIFLGIPLPPIFVSTTASGVWELVDGLQRVSTLLELQGILRGPDGALRAPLTLKPTKYLPALGGLSWSQGGVGPGLTDAQQRDIKRARIDVQIIQRESSNDAKYDLFQRLNTYGSQLTAQELRSCLLVSVNPDFFAWIEHLAKLASFRETIGLSERLLSEQYDIELVLRFLFLHARTALRRGDLTGFSVRLDDACVAMAENFPANREEMERTFVKTFDLIHAHAGDDAFRKWDPSRGRFLGSFLNTSYEVIGLGLGYHVANGTSYRTDILQAAKDLWSGPTMAAGTLATGLSTEARLSRYMPVGRDLLSDREAVLRPRAGH